MHDKEWRYGVPESDKLHARMADSTAHGSNRRRKLSRASTSYRYCEHANQTSLAVYNDDGVSNTASASSSVADTAPLPPTMDNPPLASLTMTHVHYDPSSRISYACAWLALVPQALCITYASLIWSTREIEILVMFAGQLGCEGLNWLLKRWIREERPTQMLGKGYGMPSSHAQFAAYFAVYLGLWVLVRHDPWAKNESKTHVPTPLWQRAGLAAAGLAGAVVVAQSRMYVYKISERLCTSLLTLILACSIITLHAKFTPDSPLVLAAPWLGLLRQEWHVTWACSTGC